jgi:two-component system response regulator
MDDRIILLVEDDPRDQELTLRALAKSKIESRVVIAHDGVEALEYLFAQGPQAGRDVNDLPALLLLDLKLPRLSGFEVLRRVRADPRTHLLPAVILTSSSEDRDRLDGYRAGANSYVRKPVDSAEFSRAVSHLGLYWLAVNEAPPLPAAE